MAFHERSPSRHHAKLHDTSDRIKTTERLPSFQELARLADETHEKKHGTDTGSSPAAIGYWQTSSTRTSRQSSTERPVFNDPFRGVPPSTPPLRASTRHIRPPSSTEHYTTQSEGRSLLLSTRPSPTSEYRRSSIRPEYEPRAPSVPSLFPQSRATSHDAPPPASRSQYYPSTAYSQPPQLPLSPHEARRASEVPYAHPGYGIAYSHDHYRHRPSWAPDSPNYARHYSRHDSTVYAPPEQHWAYGYAAPYAYSIDGVHHDGMGRKRRGNLPKEATAILKKWFQDHCESPYPTDEEKNKLAISTGLSNAQISNWFINARRRTPGREAREIARQNRANQQLIQGQQQAQGQEAGEERPHSTQTTRPVPTQQPQQTEQLQQHHHHQRSQSQLEQQHSRLPAQEQQRLPPTESHYRHRGHSREVSGDQEMHDV